MTFMKPRKKTFFTFSKELEVLKQSRICIYTNVDIDVNFG
jgi:hypothetical protein